MGNRDAAHADSAHGVAGSDQKVAIRRDSRLHNPGIGWPRVFPKQLAVRRCDTRSADCAHQHNLSDSVDGHQMWRAVAVTTAVRAEPAWSTGREVVGDE